MTSNKTIKNYPLSSVQKEICFDQILHPDVPLYNIGGYLQIDGPVDPTLFERAINQVIENNDALRIRIHEGESLPTQTFAENVHLELDFHDFSMKENAHQQALEWMQREFVTPFQLIDGLLFQFALCKISENCYYWFKKYHHLIVDKWALSLIGKRVAAAYNALAVEQSDGEQTHDSYQDFIQNDQTYLASDKFAKAQRYWLDKYREIPEPLMMRRYAAQFKEQTIPSQRAILHIKRPIYNQLIDFANKNNVSLFHVILGVLYCYFVRTSDREDLVVGLPTRNRSRAAFKQTVGFFAGAIPAWFRFGMDLSFVELVQAIRNELKKDYRNQRFSLREIHQRIGLSAQNRQQLFDIELSYEKHNDQISFNGSPTNAVHFSHGFERNALTLSIHEFHNDQDVRVDFDYNLGAFNASEIDLIKARFKFLFSEIIKHPDVPIKKLQIMPDEERHKILVEFNDTATDYPQNKCIHQLFEEQVKKTPDAVAVVFEDQQLTYRELNRKANQLAHYLVSLGVKPEVLVGICIERSLEMVIGLLGILKAGGAYLPLDPTYPAARLAFMLEDAKVPVLLTQSSLTEKLPKMAAQVICLDAEVLSRYHSENIESGVTPTNLAYVIYTSGSTGVPKGVMVEHRNVLAMLYGFEQVAPVIYPLRGLSVCPFSFDVSVWEFFINLCFGGTLHIVDLELLIQPTNFVDYLFNQQINCTYVPPALLAQVVNELEKRPFEVTLQRLLIGVEPIKQGLMQRYRDLSHKVNIINGYGPTETTICATFYPFIQADKSERQIPIGKPLQGYQTYVMDSRLQPSPIGIPGELYIAGAGLTRGYLNHPELTAEKFIPNPFSQKPNARIYKTGDLARYFPDGNIEYLGRLDNQVKIRGFRIELGEIEAVLATHPAVQENVVIVHNLSGDKRLVSYLVPNDRQLIDNTELRIFLKDRLPDYMIPSAFITLESLPLTPNGKIDRSSLSQLSVNSYQLSEEQFVAPRTPEEELLVGIWVEVLGIERVGVQDNFFELGGHSLLATQVMSRIRDTFEVELPLRELFESPTIAGLNLNDKIHAARQQSPLPKITPINRSESLPLSFAQQRLWFLNQLEGPNATYNIPVALRLEGSLHQNALEQSLQALVERHESLRTVFPTVNGTPVVQLKSASFKLEVFSLHHDLSSSEQAVEVQKLINEDAQNPFDLEKGSLFRTTLFRLDSHSHVLLLNMHHIISDGWSLGVFIRELGILYDAFSNDKPSPLAQLPIQYMDFAHWQRQWLTGEVLEQQMNYWKRQLAGVSALLELPTDYLRSPVQRFQGASLSFSLSADLTAQLKHLSQQAGTTLFMTLWSAFATLLSRYSGQSDIIIGSPIANRTHRQTESLIGFFVNTLVLRLDLTENPPFEYLLQQARRVALEAYTHQDISFEQLVAELQPERNLSHTPLFQVMFALQNAPISDLELAGLSLTRFDFKNVTAKFDLTLDITETASGLVSTLEYNTDLFERATIERMTTHLETLLTGIVESPITPIHELPLLTVAEQQQLLAWNKTAIDYPKDLCIHQLFEEEVEKTPDAVAVVFEDQQLTYRELNCKANQLAHYLFSLGVKPEVLVGICIERSLEMVIGLLGILKAGGAYLPLDPTYPMGRLAFMLEDALVRVLLTQSNLTDKLPKTTAQVIFLDVEVLSQYHSENIKSGAKSENLAYVIYTSGSTGQPKGVLISHSNVTRLFAATQSWFHFNNQEVWTLFHSVAFDFSVWELWGALLYGGTLIVVPYFVSRSPKAFYELLCNQGVTVLNQTPSAFIQLIQIEEQQEIRSDLNLRFIIFGGEALEFQSLKPWFEQHGDKSPQLVNMYGITETTVHVTYRPLTKADLNSQGSMIGTPIQDLQAYILDNHLQFTPIGVPSELHVGGAGLARGYLNRPELTAQKFIKNPFSDDPDARLYKTGDLARYMPDGNIEYLGRIDNQVKIRGFRIELGEIEAVLATHPAVIDNVIIVHHSSGDKRLVSYLVPNHGEVIDNTELRTFLKDKLPDYMIPSAFVTLESLPLTRNGKIDRKALSQLSVESYQLSEETFVVPRTPEEELLAGIWAEVLGIERVGVQDNFFELGGHSLLATQVISRLRDTFEVELPLRELFESPTVAGLNDKIHAARQQSPLPKITPINRSESLPLSFAQQRLWFLNQLEGPSATYNIPIALQIKGVLQQNALEQSLHTLVQRHDSLRTVFPTVNGTAVVQLESSGYQLEVFSLQDLPSSEQDVEVQRLINEYAQKTFDLEKGPLFRATLFQLDSQSHVLLLNMHHIISDGWSLAIFIREWGILYGAFSNEKPSPLAPLPIQYVDFSHWQRQWLTGEVLEQQVNYWKKQLAGMPPLLELPTDYPRPPIQRFQGANLQLVLKPELTAQLKHLSQQTGTTPFMILWSTFAILLSRYSGQSDIVIGSPIANRTHSQTESLIGFFVNTLVLRLNLSDNPPFKNILQQARRVALEAYSHQDIPFEQLVEEINPDRNLSHSPLFQVMLVLQNTPVSTLDLRDLTVTSLAFESQTTKFDLNFHLSETAQGLIGTLYYNTDLFAQVTIRRMLEHFQNLLADIVIAPEKRLSALRLLSESERCHLSTCVNQVHPTQPFIEFKNKECTLVERFEQQVKQSPNHVAVKTQRDVWTYKKLNDKANQVAQSLLMSGQEEERVALLFEHDASMIVGILGTLKAGKTYVPLNPDYPNKRLAYILRDSQANILLTNHKNVGLAQSLKSNTLRLINLDEIELVVERNDIYPSLSGETIAYLLYTSGSTGKPKGVIQNHRNVLHFIRRYTNNLHITADDRLTLLASISFDAAVVDIFAALLNGATLYPFNLKEDMATLYHWLIQEQITIYHSIPTVYRHFIQALTREEQFPHLRLVVLGGEAVEKRDVDKYQQFFADHCIFINLLGQTESTISLQYFLNKQTENTRTVVSVGYPIAETEILLLDDYGEKTEIYGEIAIRSPYLALGYWQKPALTQSVFLPDPEGGNRRIYRTGDMGRLLPDGRLEFVGRKDFQIKIRGFRIELGEIEAVLATHSFVTESAVIVHEYSQSDQRLVAYLVPNQGQDIENSELRAFLKERLPDYMIPSAFVTLESLPLTPNGKIDRRTLEQKSLDYYQLSEETFVAPRTLEEELLAGIWASVLGIERVGVHDNFFELGGHSLLATQIISRLRDTFEVELPLRELFEAPTIAGLNDKIHAAYQQSPLPKITPINRSKPLPLSFAQQRLWFLNQLEGPSATYNMPFALRLEGPLHQNALEQSLHTLVQRHDSLRTVFPTVNGTPVVQLENESFKLERFSLQDLPSRSLDVEVQRLINEDAQKPFDLEKGPLFRSTLFQTKSHSHFLLLNMHHIISDGWSRGIFIREWAILYDAFSNEKPSPLAPLPIQYVDFAHWQRQWLSGKILEKQLDYWKQQLKGMPALLELPTDYPRPPVQRFQGAYLQVVLKPELTAQLKHLSQQTGTTLFMMLWSAFAILLSRYSGQSDIVIGSPIANRTYSQIESLIGFFINTLVLRLDLTDNPHFKDVLQQARRVALEAYTHQDIPFEQLVEEINPARNLSHSPLFQVMLVLQNTPVSSLDLRDLTVTSLAFESQTTKFDLNFHLSETAQGLIGTLYYNTDLFAPVTISRMLEHFQTLLADIVLAPEKRLSALRLLSESERCHLSTCVNQVHPTQPFIEFKNKECSLVERFEQQVKQYPNHIAVKTQRDVFTYQKLNDKANQVAQSLLMACQEEERVALLFEHDASMIVGILGTLKAGKTYVPLNPDYPNKRLAYILRDSQANILLTNHKNVGLAEALTSNTFRLINLDEIELVVRDDIHPNIEGDTIAYLLYTSGSTGKPKGVIQNHRNVLHFIRHYTNNLHITADDHLTLLSSFGFDAAVMDIFAALLNGATLYPFNLKEDMATFSHWLIQEQITIYHSIPTVYRHFIQTLTGVEQFPHLRLVVLGGEAVDKGDVDKYQQFFADHCIFINGLGPTESTISFQYFLNKQTENTRTAVPVGYPIAETEILLLDNYGEKTEIYGEIAIRSPYLALGYWQKPALTQSVFLPDPEGGNRRIYRTGDMGRLLPDGRLEFVGRKDFQIKIRGFRIELGEIEAVLVTHPFVTESVVIVHEYSQSDQRLVAYLVANQGQVIDNTELHAFLTEQLPDYMIPQILVSIETMPLTPNGKIDRRALSLLSVNHEVSEEQFVAPRDTLELLLTKIWEKMLNVRPIGVYDNFFELGGHSLLAITLLGRIEKNLGQGLSVMALFQAPTIAQLAELLREKVKSVWCALEAIQPQGIRPPLFFIGSTNYARILAPALGTNQPVYGLNLFGLQSPDGTTPFLDVKDIAKQYIQDIQTVQPEGPYYLAGYCADAKVAFEMAQQFHAVGQKIALLAFIDVIWEKQNRYYRHWYNFLKFGPEYLSHKIKGQLKLTKFLLELSLSKLSAKWHRHKNNPLPVKLQHMMLINEFYKALGNYVPKPYPGSITLFLSSDWRLQHSTKLNQLAIDGVETYDISSYHDTLFESPQVEILGEQLRKCLDKAANS